MASRTKAHPDLTAFPMLPHEAIYIGVDIGKFKHVAGFISKTLLERHQHFENCPAFLFEQSREGFRTFVERVRAYCPLEQCFIVYVIYNLKRSGRLLNNLHYVYSELVSDVLFKGSRARLYIMMEQTGHYHRPLLQYLLELDLSVYVIHVQSRQTGILKTDKRDALGLANHLYNQLALGAQVENKLQVIRRAVPPSEAAAQLKGLMRHRYELANEATQRKNKLTAICDELFPELVQVFKNPNLPRALDLREKFPTPHAVATASLVALREVRRNSHPSEAQLVLLQQLAAQSIGTKDIARQRSLLLEQELLIKELRLIQEHMERLEMEVAQIVEQSREGQILLSIPPICPTYAAAILAAIGHIANFPSAGDLKSYFGWAPKRSQTGVSFDHMSLTKGGIREMKKIMYLVAWNAIQGETEWASLYKRLVPRLCPYDERTQVHKGRGKAVGHVIGRLITLIYALLKQDDETLSRLAPGTPPPEPVLYDPELHKRHRTGHYQPLRKKLPENRIVLVQP